MDIFTFQNEAQSMRIKHNEIVVAHETALDTYTGLLDRYQECTALGDAPGAKKLQVEVKTAKVALDDLESGISQDIDADLLELTAGAFKDGQEKFAACANKQATLLAELPDIKAAYLAQLDKIRANQQKAAKLARMIKKINESIPEVGRVGVPILRPPAPAALEFSEHQLDVGLLSPWPAWPM